MGDEVFDEENSAKQKVVLFFLKTKELVILLLGDPSSLGTINDNFETTFDSILAN